MLASFLSVLGGITGDLLRTNRALIEDSLEHTKKMRFGMLSPSDERPVDLADRPATAPRRPRKAS